jgi:N-acylglucosamine-6-phosphate 2-epimerase
MLVMESTLPQFVVSVQAEDHEPLAPTPILFALCQSVLEGGAEGLRVANLELIRRLKAEHPTLPIIALHKPYPLPTHPKEVVYITRRLEDALALAEAGADVIALDATPRDREESLSFIVASLKSNFPQLKVMGDIDSLASAAYALDAGVDVLSTTLSGYTLESQTTDTTPDFALLEKLVKMHPTTPIYLEGRVWHPQEVERALDLGAFGVVIGSAITRPHQITARFNSAF